MNPPDNLNGPRPAVQPDLSPERMQDDVRRSLETVRASVDSNMPSVIAETRRMIGQPRLVENPVTPNANELRERWGSPSEIARRRAAYRQRLLAGNATVTDIYEDRNDHRRLLTYDEVDAIEWPANGDQTPQSERMDRMAEYGAQMADNKQLLFTLTRYWDFVELYQQMKQQMPTFTAEAHLENGVKGDIARLNVLCRQRVTAGANLARARPELDAEKRVQPRRDAEVTRLEQRMAQAGQTVDSLESELRTMLDSSQPTVGDGGKFRVEQIIEQAIINENKKISDRYKEVRDAADQARGNGGRVNPDAQALWNARQAEWGQLRNRSRVVNAFGARFQGMRGQLLAVRARERAQKQLAQDYGRIERAGVQGGPEQTALRQRLREREQASFNRLKEHARLILSDVATEWKTDDPQFGDDLAYRIGVLQEPLSVSDVPGAAVRAVRGERRYDEIYDALDWPRDADGDPIPLKDMQGKPEHAFFLQNLERRKTGFKGAIDRFKAPSASVPDKCPTECLISSVETLEAISTDPEWNVENLRRLDQELGELPEPPPRITKENYKTILQDKRLTLLIAYNQLLNDWNEHNGRLETFHQEIYDLLGIHYRVSGGEHAEFARQREVEGILDHFEDILITIGLIATTGKGRRFLNRTLVQPVRWVGARAATGGYLIGKYGIVRPGMYAATRMYRGLRAAPAAAATTYRAARGLPVLTRGASMVRGLRLLRPVARIPGIDAAFVYLSEKELDAARDEKGMRMELMRKWLRDRGATNDGSGYNVNGYFTVTEGQLDSMCERQVEVARFERNLSIGAGVFYTGLGATTVAFPPSAVVTVPLGIAMAPVFALTGWMERKQQREAQRRDVFNLDGSLFAFMHMNDVQEDGKHTTQLGSLMQVDAGGGDQDIINRINELNEETKKDDIGGYHRRQHRILFADFCKTMMKNNPQLFTELFGDTCPPMEMQDFFDKDLGLLRRVLHDLCGTVNGGTALRPHYAAAALIIVQHRRERRYRELSMRVYDQMMNGNQGGFSERPLGLRSYDVALQAREKLKGQMVFGRTLGEFDPQLLREMRDVRAANDRWLAAYNSTDPAVRATERQLWQAKNDAEKNFKEGTTVQRGAEARWFQKDAIRLPGDIVGGTGTPGVGGTVSYGVGDVDALTLEMDPLLMLGNLEQQKAEALCRIWNITPQRRAQMRPQEFIDLARNTNIDTLPDTNPNVAEFKRLSALSQMVALREDVRRNRPDIPEPAELRLQEQSRNYADIVLNVFEPRARTALEADLRMLSDRRNALTGRIPDLTTRMRQAHARGIVDLNQKVIRARFLGTHGEMQRELEAMQRSVEQLYTVPDTTFVRDSHFFDRARERFEEKIRRYFDATDATRRFVGEVDTPTVERPGTASLFPGAPADTRIQMSDNVDLAADREVIDVLAETITIVNPARPGTMRLTGSFPEPADGTVRTIVVTKRSWNGEDHFLIAVEYGVADRASSRRTDWVQRSVVRAGSTLRRGHVGSMEWGTPRQPTTVDDAEIRRRTGLTPDERGTLEAQDLLSSESTLIADNDIAARLWPARRSPITVLHDASCRPDNPANAKVWDMMKTWTPDASACVLTTEAISMPGRPRRIVTTLISSSPSGQNQERRLWEYVAVFDEGPDGTLTRTAFYSHGGLGPRLSRRTDVRAVIDRELRKQAVTDAAAGIDTSTAGERQDLRSLLGVDCTVYGSRVLRPDEASDRDAMRALFAQARDIAPAPLLPESVHVYSAERNGERLYLLRAYYSDRIVQCSACRGADGSFLTGSVRTETRQPQERPRTPEQAEVTPPFEELRIDRLHQRTTSSINLVRFLPKMQRAKEWLASSKDTLEGRGDVGKALVFRDEAEAREWGPTMALLAAEHQVLTDRMTESGLMPFITVTGVTRTPKPRITYAYKPVAARTAMTFSISTDKVAGTLEDVVKNALENIHATIPSVQLEAGELSFEDADVTPFLKRCPPALLAAMECPTASPAFLSLGRLRRAAIGAANDVDPATLRQSDLPPGLTDDEKQRYRDMGLFVRFVDNTHADDIGFQTLSAGRRVIGTSFSDVDDFHRTRWADAQDLWKTRIAYQRARIAERPGGRDLAPNVVGGQAVMETIPDVVMLLVPGTYDRMADDMSRLLENPAIRDLFPSDFSRNPVYARLGFARSHSSLDGDLAQKFHRRHVQLYADPIGFIQEAEMRLNDLRNDPDESKRARWRCDIALATSLIAIRQQKNPLPLNLTEPGENVDGIVDAALVRRYEDIRRLRDTLVAEQRGPVLNAVRTVEYGRHWEIAKLLQKNADSGTLDYAAIMRELEGLPATVGDIGTAFADRVRAYERSLIDLRLAIHAYRGTIDAAETALAGEGSVPRRAYLLEGAPGAPGRIYLGSNVEYNRDAPAIPPLLEQARTQAALQPGERIEAIAYERVRNGAEGRDCAGSYLVSAYVAGGREARHVRFSAVVAMPGPRITASQPITGSAYRTRETLEQNAPAPATLTARADALMRRSPAIPSIQGGNPLYPLYEPGANPTVELTAAINTNVPAQEGKRHHVTIVRHASLPNGERLVTATYVYSALESTRSLAGPSTQQCTFSAVSRTYRIGVDGKIAERDEQPVPTDMDTFRGWEAMRMFREETARVRLLTATAADRVPPRIDRVVESTVNGSRILMPTAMPTDAIENAIISRLVGYQGSAEGPAVPAGATLRSRFIQKIEGVANGPVYMETRFYLAPGGHWLAFERAADSRTMGEFRPGALDRMDPASRRTLFSSIERKSFPGYFQDDPLTLPQQYIDIINAGNTNPFPQSLNLPTEYQTTWLRVPPGAHIRITDRAGKINNFDATSGVIYFTDGITQVDIWKAGKSTVEQPQLRLLPQRAPNALPGSQATPVMMNMWPGSRPGESAATASNTLAGGNVHVRFDNPKKIVLNYGEADVEGNLPAAGSNGVMYYSINRDFTIRAWRQEQDPAKDPPYVMRVTVLRGRGGIADQLMPPVR